jgi:L-histidine N-alpha-methyltransferase
VGDFHDHLDAIPAGVEPRLVAFLGSTIGNLEPTQRKGFLAGLGSLLQPQDRFLLATDLVKPVDRLVAAYDDAAGVTAAFKLNQLHVLNRQLGASFDPEQFDHVAEWNVTERWIEMRLAARSAMTVDVPDLGLHLDFAEGEQMRTEISAKFTAEQVRHELAGAGMAAVANWTDPAGDYLVTLARPV